MMKFSMERDFISQPEFRRLVTLLPDEAGEPVACLVYTRLFIDLSHLLALEPMACLPVKEFDIFYAFCRIQRICTKDQLLNALLGSGLIVEQGDYYFCRRFFQCNDTLAFEGLGHQLKTYERKSLTNRAAKFNKSAGTISKFMPADWRVLDGELISDALFNRALVIIRMIDSIIGRGARPTTEFTHGLIQDAMRIAQRFDRDRMEMFFERFMMKRKSNDLPRSTERILGNFDETLVRLEPAWGWTAWERILKTRPRNEIEEFKKNATG